jgi:hypothetical protein
MKHIQEARREARSWWISGTISLTLGAVVLALSHDAWPAVAGSLLFLLAGLYLCLRTIPFLRNVKSLLNDAPVNMTLALRGNESHMSYHAELRAPNSAQPDIVVFVGYRDWLSKVTEPIPVKVWGARQKRGPVIIESQFGILVPAGPGAVTRCG